MTSIGKLVAPTSGTTLAKEARQARARAARASRIQKAERELELGASLEGKKLSASAIVERVIYLSRFGIPAVPGSRFRWTNGKDAIMAEARVAADKPGARLPPPDLFLVAKSFGFKE